MGHTTNESKVTAIYIYPVKSCAGIKVDSARTALTGFEYDRLWMVVDEKTGKFVSQRNFPRLALVNQQINFDQGYLVLTTESMPSPLRLPLKPKILSTGEATATEDGRPVSTKVDIWGSEVTGFDCGPEPARWFTEFVGKPCRVLFKDPDTIRPVASYQIPKEAYPTTTASNDGSSRNLVKTPETGFSDGFPILIATQNSIDEVNSRLPKPENPLDFDKVDHLTFRPNIIISCPSDTPAYDEESWVKFNITPQSSSGSDKGRDAIQFYVNCRAIRCSMPNVVRSAGKMSKNKEPTKTMRMYRRTDPIRSQHPCFGMNTTPFTFGDVISVGDIIRVIERTD
ncbi:hypothetical protein H4219_005261 [Mycoemilia scoparia]|uniref:MOSC domain-containing protein n=1 Tax=Mycoemilia scoparia TaxID=417184 RepID=A0A9W7ZTP1_9FUNG|nr:hypothetical protein H4219_005261 [Mycoemilia scoparia]